MCFALTGDAAQAEALTGAAMFRGLDDLQAFQGDESGFEAMLLREAAALAARQRPVGLGLRQSLAGLGTSNYELIALRLYAGLDTEQLSAALGGRPAALRARLLDALRSLAGERGGALGPWGPDLADFDRAVGRVMAGGRPQREARDVTRPTDVLARLRTVASLRGLERPPLSPPAALEIRADVLAAAAERRVAWVQQNVGGPIIAGVARKRHPHRFRAWVAAGAFVLAALVAGAALAALASIADPDSPLYPVKRAGESALFALNTDRVGRADLEVKLAQARTREAEDMASRGGGALAAQAVRDRIDLLRRAADDLGRAQNHDGRWRSVRDELFAAGSDSLVGVERDLDAKSEPGPAGLVRALDQTWLRQQPDLERRLGKPQPAPSATPAA